MHVISTYMLQLSKYKYSQNFVLQIHGSGDLLHFSSCIINHTSSTVPQLTVHLMYLVFYELFCYVTLKLVLFSRFATGLVCSKDEVNYPRRHSLFIPTIRPSRSCLSYLFASFYASIRKQRDLVASFPVLIPGFQRELLIGRQISGIYETARDMFVEGADKIFDRR